MNAITSKSKLKAVPPKAAKPAKPKVLIYGKPGVGKTWASIDFPSVYFIDTEGGANLPHYTAKLEAAGGVYFGPEHGANDFPTVIEQVQALASEKHNYRTLVIDSATKLFNDAVTREAERLGEKDAFGASKKPAVNYMKRLVSWLNRLDMNVIMVAHAKDEYAVSSAGQRDVIGQTFDCWPTLEYELHLCLRVEKRASSRVAIVRKSRLTGFPDGTTFPWAYADFADRYGREVLEANAEAISLASQEQLSEITRLLGVVKIEDAVIAKWLAAAGADTWAEMDTDKAAGVIAHLKKTIGVGG